PRVALWALPADFGQQGRRRGTVGAALWLNGHLHFTLTSGCQTPHRHTCRNCAYELSSIFPLHTSRLRHLVRCSFLRRHQDGTGRTTHEGRVTSHHALAGRRDAGPGRLVLFLCPPPHESSRPRCSLVADPAL